MKVAANPLDHKEVWQNADDAWGFLAAILEIKAARDSGNIEKFKSNLMVGWDCSISGLQILSALARSRNGAKQCNLTNTDVRSDFYEWIASKTFKNVEMDLDFMLDIMSELDMRSDALFDAYESEDQLLILEAKEAQKKYWKDNKEDIDLAASMFFSQDLSVSKRKLVKRGCLSYFYSCEAWTMGEQIHTDHAPDINGLNFRFCIWLGEQVYDACKKALPEITAVMELFKHMGYSKAVAGEDLDVKSPLHHGRLIQWYHSDATAQIDIKIKGRRAQPKIWVGKETKPLVRKSERSAPANLTHFWDANLLFAIVRKAKYDVSLVHDCFFCHAANGEQLLKDSREAFKELFAVDHLKNLCIEQDCMDEYEKLEIGDWSSKEMISNDWCIS